MTFQEFESHIISQINANVTIKYGSVGTGYLFVLGVNDNKEIVEYGEIIYRAYRENLCGVNMLQNFGIECEKYRIGLRKEMPSLHFHPTDLSDNWTLQII